MIREWESVHPVTGEHLSHVEPVGPRPLEDREDLAPRSSFDEVFGPDKRSVQCFDELTKQLPSEHYSEGRRRAALGNIGRAVNFGDSTRSRSG